MLAIAKGLRPIAKALPRRPVPPAPTDAARYPPSVVSASPARVAVFGAGYVGLVTGACFAELGHPVVVRDVIAERVAALQRGEVPIYEPGLEELIVEERGPAHLHDRRRRGDRRSGVRLHRRRHAADVLGRRRPLGGVDRDRRAPRDRATLRRRDEEHRPGRHRARGCATASTSAG